MKIKRIRGGAYRGRYSPGFRDDFLGFRYNPGYRYYNLGFRCCFSPLFVIKRKARK
jgi:formylglycine-generating enzyme required for sulfatase activity